MKQVRTEVYDPSYKTPKLNSPIDDAPAILPAQKRGVQPILQPEVSISMAEASTSQNDQASRRVTTRARNSTPTRSLGRYSYEVYKDQVKELIRMSNDDRLAGGKGSMSAMIREAIDDYIEKRKDTRVGE